MFFPFAPSSTLAGKRNTPLHVLCVTLLPVSPSGLSPFRSPWHWQLAAGVAPQYGLYTAAVAGIVIALTGGSRFSVSGPTAAFVVILYPVSQQFGLAGLLVATLMSGVFLILFGLARFGRLIEYIPLSVTLGFTSGIGITIGTMQIKDFLGLQMAHVPEHYLQKVGALFMALPTANPGDAAIGLLPWAR